MTRAAGDPAGRRPDRAHDRRPGGDRPRRARRSSRPAAAQEIDTPDALLPREPDAGQRLPRLRRRGRGLARARARLLADGRAEDERQDRQRARAPVAQDRPRVPGLLGRPLVRLAPRCSGWMERYGADPSASARRRRPPRRASATRPGPATTTRARRRGRDRRPAGQGRQRSLRPRLRQVHPLLQVRRGLRHRRAEHVRDRRRRPRLRRPHLDRVRDAAARLRLRLLRQLHRRLPDGRADVQERARHARRPAPGTSRGRP